MEGTAFRARHPKNNRPRFRVVHHCGEAAPNVSPLGHGRIIPRDGGGVVAAVVVRSGCGYGMTAWANIQGTEKIRVAIWWQLAPHPSPLLPNCYFLAVATSDDFAGGEPLAKDPIKGVELIHGRLNQAPSSSLLDRRRLRVRYL